jgi:F-type H+-transporting ATPase subunit gamma
MPANLKKIQTNLHEAQTIENVSSIFEITATIRINQLRSGVVASNEFFTDLWNTYRQLLRSMFAAKLPTRNWKYDKALNLIITSAGNFSGPSDEEIIAKAFSDQETAAGDFIIIGSKGVALLENRGKKPILSFETPDIRRPIDVTGISELIRQYKYAWAFYQSFESIGVQQVRRINLLPASVAVSDNEVLSGRPIDVQTYIFEPSYDEIAKYLESVVLNITLTQIIFESKLSEYANRFKLTSLVKDRAKERVKELSMTYNRRKRQTKTKL